MTAPHHPAQLLREDPAALAEVRLWLARASIEARVDYALENLPHRQVLSSSFGAQSAVSLHLITSRAPNIPVVLIDTGYLFAETYRFIDALQQRLHFDLRVYQAEESPAWFEARHGRLWEQGLPGIERYNQLRKVAPFQRALEELGVATWYAGLRRDQSQSRRAIEPLELRGGRFKLQPLFDQSNRQLHQYLARHDLPYHPLWDQGYVSIGDHHSTRPLSADMNEESTRFHGLKRECGLHEEPQNTPRPWLATAN